MSTLMYIVVLVLIFGVLLTFINVWELRRMQAEHMNMHGMPEAETFEGGVSKKPTVWVKAKNVRVYFRRFGWPSKVIWHNALEIDQRIFKYDLNLYGMPIMPYFIYEGIICVI